MALPSDYWRNPQMHNVFRTKPCQRLLYMGCCAWGSQCQFSHNLNFPRRPPRGHSYSAEMCPHVENIDVVATSDNAIVENACPAGKKCVFAHSKEEVLYHSHIFKTTLCKEHQTIERASSRSRRKKQCHRHYCPFAHGVKELRSSPLSADVRKRFLLHALNAFPSNACCKVCDPFGIPPQPVAFLGGWQEQRGDDRSFVSPDGAPQHVSNTSDEDVAVTHAPVNSLTEPAGSVAVAAAGVAQLANAEAGGNKVQAVVANTAAQMCDLQGFGLPPGLKLDDDESGATHVGSTQYDEQDEEDEDTEDESVPKPCESSDQDCALQAVFAENHGMDGDVSPSSMRKVSMDLSLQFGEWKEEEERIAGFLGL
eukprot:TRINITY_DN61883_c0_g1_i1.p1 TRINITY_DN61883_c0_g1~~TRINITY_DN61883_c0_g1_i1.p1  ORF type:complete len:385 (-),score=53.92 TRINITY_DN61883_c0_g1_i1:63-1163(-)